MKSIFEKIIDREISAEILYEDEQVIAVKDINPVAPVHILVITKKKISSLQTFKPEEFPLIQRVYQVIQQLAKENGLSEKGYRVVNNVGIDGGQTVDHIHFHLLGGRPLEWPPG
jgi:histidine triad (HIT) family protein